MAIIEAKCFQVSAQARPAAIQHLIDESFSVRVLPLHNEMFKGACVNYLFWGQNQDYDFDEGTPSVVGIKASKIAEEFAAKQKFAVLDLGCGVGTFLQSLKKRFQNVEVLGVSAADFRPTHYNREGIKVPDSEYVVANLENLTQIPALQGRRFDLIVSSVTFRHLSDPLGVLCQAYDLLNENGILIVDEFRLHGIPAEEYLKIFKESGCHIEAAPVVYVTRDEKGQARFQSDKSQAGEYILSADFPHQTKIRKVALEHLSLPISYNTAKSTPATDQDQAHIFYSLRL
ncbi:MAG: class I SAM-dependent methyltransferase [Verrucomicrobia bacterium]|nr:class I SAM-dependent methyltransferase [Verrucomicrobiota bacterium]